MYFSLPLGRLPTVAGLSREYMGVTKLDYALVYANSNP